jgi:hypothetical protein
MKPTFDSRIFNRRFRLEWAARHEATRLFVESRRRDGGVAWRKVWTSGQAERGFDPSWPALARVLDIDYQALTAALDGSAIKVEMPQLGHADAALPDSPAAKPRRREKCAS